MTTRQHEYFPFWNKCIISLLCENASVYSIAVHISSFHFTSYVRISSVTDENLKTLISFSSVQRQTLTLRADIHCHYVDVVMIIEWTVSTEYPNDAV